MASPRDREDVRLALAKDFLTAMIRSMDPEADRAGVNEREYARKAVAFADALLEALERGNAR